jgi:hypothetical protein
MTPDEAFELEHSFDYGDICMFVDEFSNIYCFMDIYNEMFSLFEKYNISNDKINDFEKEEFEKLLNRNTHRKREVTSSCKLLLSRIR